MNLSAMKETNSPDELASDHLRALWYDLHGDWDTAHRIVQVMEDHDAMWIHAYLHRKEPDISNAKYWYRRCAEPYPEGMSSDAEADRILAAIRAGGSMAV